MAFISYSVELRVKLIGAYKWGGGQKWEVGEGKVGWVLADVYARRLSVLGGKLACCFKLAVDMVGSGIYKFVDNVD